MKITSFFFLQALTCVRGFPGHKASASMLLILMVIVLSLVSGCSKYAVTFNEKVLYTPPVLFTEFKVADKKLHSCIGQTINDNNITKTSELKYLTCTYTGITSLEGLEQFDQIEVLNLANNQITELTPLKQLTKISQLNVRNNQLQDISSLLALLRLKKADLSNNPNLICEDLEQLSRQVEGELTLPARCVRRGIKI